MLAHLIKPHRILSESTRAYRATMSAWQVGDSTNNSKDVSPDQKLKLSTNVKVPTISKPSDILVKVHATSINPLDLRMLYGYGRRVLDLMDMAMNCEPRISNDRYPLTLGRDFSGEVVAVGPKANHRIGDIVFGAIEPHRSGAHAEYVCASSSCVTTKPQNLSHEEAASIPFTALTAYSAISTFGQLSRAECPGKRVLVIGGSGGVGSIAVQLLKHWGAQVSATSSKDKLEWLENNLFVAEAIDHHDQLHMDSLAGRFDFVLDCGDYDGLDLHRGDIVDQQLKLLKPFSKSCYVTLSPPFLKSTDEHGVVLGTAKSTLEAAVDTIKGLRSFNSARWAFFMPNKPALDYIGRLLQEESIQAYVSKAFEFGELPDAFVELSNGQTRGKNVVRMAECANEQQAAASG